MHSSCGRTTSLSILEKSATVRVVARMRFNSRKRFSRKPGSWVLTVTDSKNSSTGARRSAIAAMAAAKSSRAIAAAAACSTSSTALARAFSSIRLSRLGSGAWS